MGGRVVNRRFVVSASFFAVFLIVASQQRVAYGQKITSPSNNTFLAAGSDQPITWTLKKDTTSIVVLQYSVNGGWTWNYIGTTGIAAGSYDWITPVGVNAYFCLVRMVKFTQTGATTVASSGSFSIARLDPHSQISHAFTHRVISLSKSGRGHYKRHTFFR